jgi:hypothetical protein
MPRVHELVLRFSGRRGLAGARSKIVIEGFFRSGNTYAFAAFRVANPRGRFQGRLHAPANVRRSVRLGRPTLVLIRRPADAAVSTAIRLPEVDVREALADYVAFYRAIRPVRSQIVVADFERVVTDFGSVIREVNDRFGTTFARYERTEENERRCVDFIERWDRDEQGGVDEMRVPRPSAERNAARERLLRELDEPATKRLLEEAERLYREFLIEPAG